MKDLKDYNRSVRVKRGFKMRNDEREIEWNKKKGKEKLWKGEMKKEIEKKKVRDKKGSYVMKKLRSKEK